MNPGTPRQVPVIGQSKSRGRAVPPTSQGDMLRCETALAGPVTAGRGSFRALGWRSVGNCGTGGAVSVTRGRV
ncbi:hypothetical protein CMUS01_16757 [Colletotrichum musicola]|uniref:Uncharacterized protein n=1 Tax=Colletotrichum musicola TaxID=2175873 RepID=A0A8H6ILW5_9PEZI|nr:hypothetical protein CMUS01_16757 [Colletotrichum musicola]